MSKVVMILGYPASSKGTHAEAYIADGYVHLNRDKEGGKVVSLLPKMEEAINAGKDVVLDNLFPNIESRKPFVELAHAMGVEISCDWMSTSLEDSQINALHRMWKRYGQLFLDPASLKAASADVKKDSNMFPIVVLFKYRKEFEKPTTAEGFSVVNKIPFNRNYDENYTNKAIFFDYDNTLRTNTGNGKYPVHPDEVVLMPGRKEKIKQLLDEGWLLLGVSNQAPIARKQLTEENAIACFDRTNELLEADIEVVYCPHSVPPSCYCRKPQSALGVYFIEKHKLDPRECIFVGDMTTDRTFASRLNIPFEYAKDFF